VFFLETSSIWIPGIKAKTILITGNYSDSQFEKEQDAAAVSETALFPVLSSA
jgi:hypothetical protein